MDATDELLIGFFTSMTLCEYDEYTKLKSQLKDMRKIFDSDSKDDLANLAVQVRRLDFLSKKRAEKLLSLLN